MKSNLALLTSVSALALTIGAANAETIDFTGAEVSYTVPVSGVYDITAYGAQGGPAVTVGGLGAEAGGDIFLSAGTVLTVLAGGKGGYAAGNGGGGGGGSFVFEGAALLAAAGGGGGGGLYLPRRADYAPGPGLGTTAGGAGKGVTGDGGPGGVGGLGGRGGVNGGGGGAGVSGPGGPGIPVYGFLAANGATSITSFGERYAPGGFGGGGGYNGGGGGGFSGGGGGSVGQDEFLGGGGGGGGSYLAPAFTDSVLLSGVNHGNGFVTIDPVVPEPSTWAMMLAGFAGLGWLARLRARRAKPS